MARLFSPASTCFRAAVWPFALALSLAACGSTHDGRYDSTDEQITDVVGSTCGRWLTSPPGERMYFTQVSCAEGLECRDTVDLYPEGQPINNWFGKCIPTDEVCYAATEHHDQVLCSYPGMSCFLGRTVGLSGICRMSCDSDYPCADPMQGCRDGQCHFLGCGNPPRCNEGTHCEFGICVQGEAPAPNEP